jgi:hypothetical protein
MQIMRPAAYTMHPSTLNTLSGKKFDINEVPSEQLPVFSISPEKLLLPPKEMATFVINGLCHRAGAVTEQLTCCVVGGNGNSAGAASKAPPAFAVQLTASVSAPLLELSQHCVEFAYVHASSSAQPPAMLQSVDVRNASPLPLSFMVKAVPPFSVSPSTLTLAPAEAGAFVVGFDHHYRSDLMTHTVRQRLAISYADSPQRDWLDAIATLDYPNLHFDAEAVDFGCVQLDSMRRVAVGVSNPGQVPVQYSWSWVSQDRSDTTQKGADMHHKQINRCCLRAVWCSIAATHVPC